MPSTKPSPAFPCSGPGKGPLHARRLAALAAAGALLAVSAAASMLLGAGDIDPATVRDALIAFDAGNPEHLVVVDIRLPRVIAGALVGAAFAVAGAIVQALTRNPLADTGILGINAGAAFALSLVFAFLPGAGFGATAAASFCGAAAGAVLVGASAFSGASQGTPMRMVLAGAAIGALLTALSQGIALYFDVAQDIMFWTVGGVASTSWADLSVLAPLVLAALAVACALGRTLSLLSLGDEAARGLGVDTRWAMAAALATALILAGASVATVGAVGFVGLIVPHLARGLVGIDCRWVIPTSALAGACLFTVADLCARMVSPPFETPVGVFTALVGVPFFLYIARNRIRGL